MTNLVLTVSLVITTNWVTVSKTIPIRNGSLFQTLGYSAGTLNQVGYRVTNFVGNGIFKGKEVSFVLEQEDGGQCATRTIEEPADNINNAGTMTLTPFIISSSKESN